MMDMNINSLHFNDEIKLERVIKKFNSCQKEVFVDVIDNIKHQELHKYVLLFDECRTSTIIHIGCRR